MPSRPNNYSEASVVKTSLAMKTRVMAEAKESGLTGAAYWRRAMLFMWSFDDADVKIILENKGVRDGDFT
jgi:hypothetical protein